MQGFSIILEKGWEGQTTEREKTESKTSFFHGKNSTNSVNRISLLQEPNEVDEAVEHVQVLFTTYVMGLSSLATVSRKKLGCKIVNSINMTFLVDHPIAFDKGIIVSY